MKVVLCSSEVVPFAKTGGLADVAGALPLALERLGHDVIIVLPRYRETQNPKFGIQKLNDHVSWSSIGRDMKVYFVENDKYFNRDQIYGNGSEDYPDNLDRFSFYCKRSMELLKEINFKPDIVHCNDWQTGLIPVYLKAMGEDDIFYRRINSIFTIHNIGYQGLFPKEEFPKLGLDGSLFSADKIELHGRISLLKAGLVFSDIINTVSEAYCQEIQTEEFGFGLEGLLSARRDSLFGILNGLDYSLWDPEKDNFIAARYSIKNIDDKYKNKQELRRFCGFADNKERPLFGIVSRLAEQKGFDILTQALPEICRMNLEIVILGTGDLKYHAALEEWVKKYPEVLSVHLKFDNSLAHKIYAGSDIFLMPSKYEPCGLGQMISFKYATIPLVFKTGGLADTVHPDNGFVFDSYDKNDLVKTMHKAIDAFSDKKKWNSLMRKGMKYDFSWEQSARKYVDLYSKAKRCQHR